MHRALRAVALLLTVLAGLGALLGPSRPAAAASRCPDVTFLSYGHLAYEAAAVPAGVRVPGGATVGTGTVDQPTNADACRRAQSSVSVQAVGSLAPQVVVRASGRPRLLFVMGHRCEGYSGAAYWGCLLTPLEFRHRQYTAIAYPGPPAARRRLALGAAIGTVRYQGREVTLRQIRQVPPPLAVGISGRPATAYVSAGTCPYSGFSNEPRYDNLLRCLLSPVWFTFDPPGSDPGSTVIARSDRSPAPGAAGAPISLVSLPLVADYVPPSHGRLIPVGRVGTRVSIRLPHVAAGLYEAVVSCPRCGASAAGVGGLYPAGSILVTPAPRTSPGIRIVSYVLAALVIVAVIFTVSTHRRRRAALAAARARRSGATRARRER